jgi:hypothetical protein
MGRKKLERPSIEGLFSTISSMLVPAHVLEHFDIWDAHEYSDRRIMYGRLFFIAPQKRFNRLKRGFSYLFSKSFPSVIAKTS